jgi:hypothetical protein
MYTCGGRFVIRVGVFTMTYILRKGREGKLKVLVTVSSTITNTGGATRFFW